MSDSVYSVETTSRLAQWRIENLPSYTCRRSEPFKMGKWNWHLFVERNARLIIRLYPEISDLPKANPPIASFVIRVVSYMGDRKAFVHPEIKDKQLTNIENFVWALEVPIPFTGKFIIELEFLDLKTASLNGEEPSSIWTEGFTQKDLNETALSSLGRMLSESIHTDIIINTSDGSISAHRAILAARSPVFRSMFYHDLKEKELSAVEIPDLSLKACQALLSYIYSNIESEVFLTHRLDLLRAADKYDISDLKEVCHKSLLEDIDTKNVLERLQIACLYRLPKLKRSCLRYLVKFGKIFDIRNEFDAFIKSADRELIGEVVHKVLTTWKGF